MRISQIARGSLFAGVVTTAAFAASFLRLDAQLSHGSLSALPTEGLKTLGLAAANILFWSIAFPARVTEHRIEAALARKAAKRGINSQLELQEEAVLAPSAERLEAA